MEQHVPLRFKGYWIAGQHGDLKKFWLTVAQHSGWFHDHPKIYLSFYEYYED